MKKVKVISLVVGVSLFMFGILKFVTPFKTWYEIQILKSGLSATNYWVGIGGKIFIGLLLLFAVIFWIKLSSRQLSFLIISSSTAIIVMMLTASYVHLQPNVPADVLPLKIKLPFIPLSFLFLAAINIILTLRDSDKLLWHTTKN